MSNSHTPFIIRSYRLARLIAHILYGVAVTAIVLPRLSASNRDRMITRWSRGLLQLFNIELRLHGAPPDIQTQGIMLIGNHVSWLDIYALNALRAVRFVAKSEIREWPVLGWLAAKANTFFIDRGLRQEASRMVFEGKRSLLAGDWLCYFPEGTTTNGLELRPFKGSLLQAAINAESHVWPFAIRYLQPDGSVDTSVAYCDEITLPQSIRKVLARRRPIIELTFLPPIAAAHADRRLLTADARAMIAKHLNLPG